MPSLGGGRPLVSHVVLFLPLFHGPVPCLTVFLLLLLCLLAAFFSGLMGTLLCILLRRIRLRLGSGRPGQRQTQHAQKQETGGFFHNAQHTPLSGPGMGTQSTSYIFPSRILYGEHAGLMADRGLQRGLPAAGQRNPPDFQRGPDWQRTGPGGDFRSGPTGRGLIKWRWCPFLASAATKFLVSCIRNGPVACPVPAENHVWPL